MKHLLSPAAAFLLLPLSLPASGFVFSSPDRTAVEIKPRLHNPAEASKFPVVTKNFEFWDIPLEEWNLDSPAIGDFDPIRVSHGDNRITMMPGTANPANSFGWIEGPILENVSNGSGDLGDQLVFQVRYNYPEGPVGQAPELRIRVHSGNFAHLSQTVVSHIAVRDGEREGVRRAYFDRNLLDFPDDMRVFIDLLSADGSGDPLDADYPVEILETVAWTTSGGRPDTDVTYTAVYIETGGQLMARISGAASPLLIRPDAFRIAWDDTNLFVITSNGRLFGYNALQPISGVLVDDFGDVADIAVLGNRVIYVTDGGEIIEWEGASGTYNQLVSSGGDGVASSPDGRHFLLLDLQPASNLFQLYRYDVTNPSSTVTPITITHSLVDMQSRWSRHF
ncbi:MAG: hypothetical protein JJU11_01010 [Candidatus Sumerlaeia bacterium]|nr:hypothetical protein [Candidatus Sumerlaeia bacterium]